MIVKVLLVLVEGARKARFGSFLSEGSRHGQFSVPGNVKRDKIKSFEQREKREKINLWTWLAATT
jgi:hypothetical protein